MEINNNPICPFDKKDCTPDITGYLEMDGYLDCSGCPRYCNGVRETGGMPTVETALESIKNMLKKK